MIDKEKQRRYAKEYYRLRYRLANEIDPDKSKAQVMSEAKTKRRLNGESLVAMAERLGIKYNTLYVFWKRHKKMSKEEIESYFKQEKDNVDAEGNC